MTHLHLFTLAFCLGTFAAGPARALDLVLPTDNDAIFTGSPENFYMHVDRWTADGVHTTPWEGGQFGFVRDPRQVAAGLIYTRFHSGVDIRPIHRDAKGEPLDEIKAIAAGRVVHVSTAAGASNYGRYIVIEHQWDGCPYYSLYAHLSDTHVTPGTEVTQAQKIARMGYTGRGINRERSHLHLEVNLLMNDEFDGFYDLHWKSGGPNRHGIYNGLNLDALDVARLYLESRKNPALTIPQFLAKEPVLFQVDIPGSQTIDMLSRYPWLEPGKTPSVGTAAQPPAAWRISFAQAGLPLRVERRAEAVTVPKVTFLQKGPHAISHLTHGLLTGTREKPKLSSSGERLIGLLTYERPPEPPPVEPVPLEAKATAGMPVKAATPPVKAKPRAR